VTHQHETHRGETRRQIGRAFLLNTVFVLVELAGGLFTNSIAILSDALHDLGDSIALGAAWYFERLSGRGRNPGYTYGYGRYSVLGAVINSLVLITGSVFVIREAVIRISQPEPVISHIVIILALVGIAVNGLAYKGIHPGHSHNAEIVRLHLLEDVLGWVAVLLGGIAMTIWELYILDPILSLAIAAWILFQVIRRFVRSLRIILQVTPEGIDEQSVESLIRSFPGVLETHDTHLWTMDGRYHILTIHIVLEQARTMSELARLKAMIRDRLKSLQIHHATIEFEYPDEPCLYEDC
jgi:cobalt-zinc-cadmium efflux system protein